MQCVWIQTVEQHIATFKTETTGGKDLVLDEQEKVKQAAEGKRSCQISRRGDAKLAGDTNCHEQPNPTHLNCCFPLCFSPVVALTELKNDNEGGRK